MNHSLIFFYFRSGHTISGALISWDTSIKLLSEDGTKTIVIPDPRDVLYYTISNSSPQTQQPKPPPSPNQKDNRPLADLKRELKKIEEEEQRQKSSTHEISAIKPTQYAYPSFITTKQHSPQEAPRENTNLDSELSDLFSKRD